jgi:hypothetical protein
VWHVGVPCSGLQVADFLVAGLEHPCEVVDAGTGGSELLGSDGGAPLHCGCESIGHGSHNFTEFIPAEADEGFSRARG